MTRPLPLPDLPIAEALPALCRGVEKITPGYCSWLRRAGKSTVVPLALLEAPWLASKKILMLEPRRLAARAVASRMAQLVGEPVGRTIGYRTRLDTKIGRDTRIEVVTEGILTRMLQENAELPAIGAVIFDEFHERSLNADLGLALSLESQQNLRDDLRILVMSATLEVQPLAKLLGDAPIVNAAGRSFDVVTHYVPRRNDLHLELQMASVIRRALDEHDGDILCFLPGAAEINRVQRNLDAAALGGDVLMLTAVRRVDRRLAGRGPRSRRTRAAQGGSGHDHCGGQPHHRGGAGGDRLRSAPPQRVRSGDGHESPGHHKSLSGGR